MIRILLLAATIAVGSCGDDDDDDDVQVDAGLDSGPGPDSGQDAAPDAGGDDGGQGTLDWTDCDDSLECASLDVPIDHRDPGGPTLSLSLIRRPASSPADRIGPLVVNFAGASVGAARSAFPMIALLAPDVAAAFDLVAFDPRGWGGSAPIDCVDDAAMEEFLASDFTPDDDGEWAVLMELFEGFTGGCVERSGDRIAHIDSESVARDMDLVREAMGDEQLSFLGISYGTLTGALYATLFPENVRAFVLDSPVAPAASAVEFVGRQADASEVELGRFLASCADDADCVFHGGGGQAAIEDAFDALLATAEEDPLAAGEESLTASLLQAGTISSLRSGDWEALASGLADAEAGDGTDLFGVASGMFGKNADGTWNNFFEVFEPTVLLDYGCPDGFDLEAAQAVAADLAVRVPRVGVAATALGVLCAAWTVERPTPPTPIDATDAPPMLVLAGLHDQSTPYEFVESFMEALGNDSHLVTWEGNGHGVSNRNLCTISASVGFIVDPTTPPEAETCPP